MRRRRGFVVVGQLAVGGRPSLFVDKRQVPRVVCDGDRPRRKVLAIRTCVQSVGQAQEDDRKGKKG